MMRNTCVGTALLLLSSIDIAASQNADDEWICTSPHFGDATHEGDFVGSEIPKSAAAPSTLWRSTHYTVEGDYRILTVHFMDGEVWRQDRVLALANEWSASGYGDDRGAFVKFVRSTGPQSSSDIKVSFSGANFSQLGSRATHPFYNTNPSMRLSAAAGLSQDAALDTDRARSVVRHEFGHALGLYHEQLHTQFRLNWNRPVMYDYYFKSDWSGCKRQDPATGNYVKMNAKDCAERVDAQILTPLKSDITASPMPDIDIANGRWTTVMGYPISASHHCPYDGQNTYAGATAVNWCPGRTGLRIVPPAEIGDSDLRFVRELYPSLGE